jgi:hypothetical protein
MLPQVSETHPLPDVYLDRGFPPACVTRKIKGVLWLDAGQCQLQLGPVGLTPPRLTMNSKAKSPRGAQNSQIPVVCAVIPGKFLLTFVLKFLKQFPNLTSGESFF